MTYAGSSSRSGRTRSASVGRVCASRSWSPVSRPLTSSAPMVSAGAASRSISSIRSCGYPGSTGTNAAPALVTPSWARTISADRGRVRATRSPGPTPRPISRCANTFARASNSANDNDKPAASNATAPGARSTAASTRAGKVTGATESICGRAGPASNRDRSAGGSTSTASSRVLSVAAASTCNVCSS